MAAFDFAKVEPKLIAFWKKNKVVERQRAKGKKGKPFYFLQGPPYTSGKFHIGHAWNYALKDMVLRYKRMNGFDVYDRGGWDMHGMPTAQQVMKKLNLKAKDDIEKYGVGKFVKECEAFALKMMEQMQGDFEKWGVTLDESDPYQPIKPEFMEGVWWCIKKAHENRYLYEGDKSMAWCANCGTAQANAEIEYETIDDTSMYMKFKVDGKKDEYLLIWTTTPWTIPFNLGVMANPDLKYARVQVGFEKWIMAADLVESVMDAVERTDYKVLSTVKGSKLEGLKYEPALIKEVPHLKNLEKKYKWAFKVVLSKEFVDLSAGTGLVHMAPGCGPEDQEVGSKYKLPAFNETDEAGYFSNKMGKFSGWRAKFEDRKFLDAFSETGLLIATKSYRHDYPHCWRCKDPVIFRTTKQWFFATSKLRNQMIKWNKQVLWVPDWAGGRAFDSWLANLKDIGITRQLHWGTPVPIWRCDSCKDYDVVGSLKELKKLAGKVPKNIHKPWIDEVKYKCKKCKKGTKVRIPDTGDVWVDAGCTSWLDLYYPTRKDLFKKYWPADFICEGKDQIRGWFNLLFDTSAVSHKVLPFKVAYMHGFVNDAQGRKMSKSLGNYIDPYEVSDKYGADVMRYYFAGAAQPGVDMNYNFEDVALKRRNVEILWNVHNYLLDYAKFLKINPAKLSLTKVKKGLGIEEKHMLSKLNSTIKQVNLLFSEYKLNEIPWALEELYLYLSRGYIKSVRDKANLGAKVEKEAVLFTIYHTLLETVKMLSVLAPFIAEEIYQDLRKEFGLKTSSVHLFDWPKEDAKLIDKKLEEQMSAVEEVVSLILAGREKMHRGIRWPVKSVTVVSQASMFLEAAEKQGARIQEVANVLDVQTAKEVKGVDYTIKVNYKKAGDKFKDNIAIVIRKIAEQSANSLMRALRKDGKIKFKEGRVSFELTEDDLIIEERAPRGMMVVVGQRFTVYLEEEETEEMIASGFAREITRKVQALRKKAGLKKTDSIKLGIDVSTALQKDLQPHLDKMREQVGARELTFEPHHELSLWKWKDQFNVRDKRAIIGFETRR